MAPKAREQWPAGGGGLPTLRMKRPSRGRDGAELFGREERSPKYWDPPKTIGHGGEVGVSVSFAALFSYYSLREVIVYV